MDMLQSIIIQEWNLTTSEMNNTKLYIKSKLNVKVEKLPFLVICIVHMGFHHLVRCFTLRCLLLLIPPPILRFTRHRIRLNKLNI